MATVKPIIRTKENLYKHFRATKHAHWRLYNAEDTKSPLASHLGNNLGDSEKVLSDFIDAIDPEGVYILDTFIAPVKGEKGYVKPETTMPFTLVEKSAQQTITGNTTQDKQSGYTPEFGEHIRLIQDNAKLSAELKYATQKLTEALEEQGRLENELRIAENLLEEGEEEEEGQSEEEEEKKPGMFGNMIPASLDQALAKLLNEKGGMLIESFFAKKTPLNNPVMNGTVSDIDTEMMAIISELRKHDENLNEHLKKLLAIAQNFPDMFKGILEHLDSMGKQEQEQA